MDPAAKPTILTTLRPPGDQWACSACTLFNQPAATACAACEAPRPSTGAGRGQRRKKPRVDAPPPPKRRASPKGAAPKKRRTTPSGGEAARQRLNAQLRKELAAAKAPRAAFYAAHRSCLEPFTSARDLDALTKKAQPLPDRVARVLVQPEAIKAELRDYQLQSLDWLADRHERCGFVPSILGDEMG